MNIKKIIYLITTLSVLIIGLFIFLENKYGLNEVYKDRLEKKTLNKDSSVDNLDLYDIIGNKIDYISFFGNGIGSLKENMFFDLNEKLKIIKNSKSSWVNKKFIVTTRFNLKSAVAVFYMKDESSIIMQAYIESPIFNQLIVASFLTDIDHDGDLDIFLIGDSGGINNVSTPWVLQNNNEKYSIATPLNSENISREKILYENKYIESRIELTVFPASQAIWLKDLDNDNVLELITIDRLNLSGEEDLSVFTKRVYKLVNGVYIIQTENEIGRKSKEFLNMQNWSPVP